jgi:hypothetical protein
VKLLFEPDDGYRTLSVNLSTFLLDYTAIHAKRQVFFVVIKLFFFSVTKFAEKLKHLLSSKILWGRGHLHFN